MRVQVTADDIVHGVRRNMCECPVARALRRAYGSELGVGYGYIIHVPSRAYLDLTPDDVTAFIRTFDMGDAVHPFEFELDLTSQLAALPE